MPNFDHKGTLFIVCAPSGAGKSSLVKTLLSRIHDIKLSISFTTRAPRPGEIDGVHYFFISPEQFAERKENGEFLESAFVHGNYYGTSKKWIEDQFEAGIDVLLEIDWQGALQVRKLFKSTDIFILPPSYEALKDRLENRNQDTPEVIARRLAVAKSEIAHYGEFDYVIINQDFDTAANALCAIVIADRQRVERQRQLHHDVFAKLGFE